MRAQGLDTRELDRAIDDLRRLEAGRAIGDAQASDDLQVAVLERLKSFEFTLYREMNQGNAPRSALGARSPVPSEFRAQVEEYYRSIARPQSGAASPVPPRPPQP